MPDDQTGRGSLDARTDDDGHITPHVDPIVRSEDIDEQVRRAREGEVSIGENTVLPGAYGPGAIATSDTITQPQPDGQSDEEARVRSEAIDQQVAASGTGAVGMSTGVQTTQGGGGVTALPGSQLDVAPTTGTIDQLDAATHAPSGKDLRPDPQGAAIAGLHEDQVEDLNDLTVKDLRQRAKSEEINLGGATNKPAIVKAIEKARKAKAKAEKTDTEALRPVASDADGEKIAVQTSVGPAEQVVQPGHGTPENPAGLKPKPAPESK